MMDENDKNQKEEELSISNGEVIKTIKSIHFMSIQSKYCYK